MPTMVSVLKVIRGLCGRCGVGSPRAVTCITDKFKGYSSDTRNADTNSKQVVMQGAENEDRVRVRRARAADVPRVLRFVREHARSAWPALAPPPSASHLVLCDYVARALAQGHSMLAEQQEARSGWSKVRGLALNSLVCPWDAVMLERWARCVRCARSRRLINFTAHCLRAPGLHDKYGARNILQVTLILPLDATNSSEIINLLAKNSIQRGRDVGFPLIRFDVSNSEIVRILEQLELKKEWEFSYETVPDKMKNYNNIDVTNEKEAGGNNASQTEDMNKNKVDSNPPNNFVAVYTSHIASNKD